MIAFVDTSTSRAASDQHSESAITGITVDGTRAAISTTTLSGYTYVLEYNEDLHGTVWIPLWPRASGTGGVVPLTDTNVPAKSRFYRVRVE
jgi:hypothetical protein